MGKKRSFTRSASDAVPVGDKVKHVIRAKNIKGHFCHWPGCKEQCKPAYWGCRHHWFRLPYELRHRIWRAYTIGQESTKRPSEEYIEAARAVQDWIKRNYPETRNNEEKAR